MSNNELNRATEGAHVIAAKNLADKMAKMSGKRTEILESLAKIWGYKCWNAYRESGKIKVEVYTPKNQKLTISPGAYEINPEDMKGMIQAVLSSVARSGYDCDYSAPLVISDDLNNYLPFSKSATGLVLSPNFKHRRFVLAHDVPNDLFLEHGLSQMGHFSGVVVLDLLGLNESLIERAKAAFPNTIFFYKAITNSITWEKSKSFFGKAADETGDDMWRARMFAMLEAFAKAGVEYDPRNVPKLESIDYGNPELKKFLDYVPGYDPENFRKGYAQNGKSKEQYSFLTMQTTS